MLLRTDSGPQISQLLRVRSRSDLLCEIDLTYQCATCGLAGVYQNSLQLSLLGREFSKLLGTFDLNRLDQPSILRFRKTFRPVVIGLEIQMGVDLLFKRILFWIRRSSCEADGWRLLERFFEFKGVSENQQISLINHQDILFAMVEVQVSVINDPALQPSEIPVLGKVFLVPLLQGSARDHDMHFVENV